MQIKIQSQIVRVGPNESVEVEIPDGSELLFQTVDRINQASVEVLTVTVSEGE